eukprot:279775_1
MTSLTVKRDARWNNRFSSAPYDTKPNKPSNDNHTQSRIEHSVAFPRTFEHCGYLDVRTKEDKPWKRRYFSEPLIEIHRNQCHTQPLIRSKYLLIYTVTNHMNSAGMNDLF